MKIYSRIIGSVFSDVNYPQINMQILENFIKISTLFFFFFLTEHHYFALASRQLAM